jgi:hypothetical protein
MSPASFQQENFLRLLILGKYPKKQLHLLYASYRSQHEIILYTIKAIGFYYNIDTSTIGLGYHQIPSLIASQLITILKNWHPDTKIVSTHDVVTIYNHTLKSKRQYSISSRSEYGQLFTTKKALSTVH